MMLAIATIMLAVLTAAPADVTGKWDGQLKASRPDGSPVEDGVLLILTQKDNVITGTVGGAEDDQHPITSGTIDGDKVVINARHNENGREYKQELTLTDDELSGTLTSGERRAELTVKRRKDK